MFKRRQPPPESRAEREEPTARRWRRPGNNGEVYIESIGANVSPVPGSDTNDGKERIARVTRDALDRVRRSIHVRTSAAES